jgi:lysophospholipid acyltransferase
MTADESHLRRLLGYVPDGAFDVTFSQMVLAQKLTSFAWNVHDGRRKIEVSRPREALLIVGTRLEPASFETATYPQPSCLPWLLVSYSSESLLTPASSSPRC